MGLSWIGTGTPAYGRPLSLLYRREPGASRTCFYALLQHLTWALGRHTSMGTGTG